MKAKWLKSIFNYFGFEIHKKLTSKETGINRESIRLKIETENKELLLQNEWLLEYNLKTIIDIGANEGQFALKMRKIMPEVRIISFEPLPNEFLKLNETFLNDPHFISFNTALGDKDDCAMMWHNEHSPSSSFLRMKDHLNHFDYARDQIPIEVRIMPLDKVMEDIEIDLPLMVKIDVQGFEEKVLQGGINILLKAVIVIIEVSFCQLYVGNVVFDDIYSSMRRLGFTYIGNYEQLHSPVNNKILQADAIFVKE